MRVLIDLFRSDDGRLEGVVHTPDGDGDRFEGVLDLLRVLEGINLMRRADDPLDRRTGDG
jgi:hypothetical protein